MMNKMRSELTQPKREGGREGSVREEGEDGGEAENGVRDTNTRDADTYRCLKIESNYRRGGKKKDEKRREE